MMAGRQPFFLQNGKLGLQFKPVLPCWLFDAEGKVTFMFLGHTPVTIHNPGLMDTWRTEGTGWMNKQPVVLRIPAQGQIEFADGIIPAPYAEMVRAGQVAAIELFLT
jgi:hypothetical protein